MIYASINKTIGCSRLQETRKPAVVVRSSEEDSIFNLFRHVGHQCKVMMVDISSRRHRSIVWRKPSADNNSNKTFVFLELSGSLLVMVSTSAAPKASGSSLGILVQGA